jgi:hypothetical protein
VPDRFRDQKGLEVFEKKVSENRIRVFLRSKSGNCPKALHGHQILPTGQPGEIDIISPPEATS